MDDFSKRDPVKTVSAVCELKMSSIRVKRVKVVRGDARSCSFGICGRCNMARPARICIRSSNTSTRRADDVGQPRGRLGINLVISIGNIVAMRLLIGRRCIAARLLAQRCAINSESFDISSSARNITGDLFID